MDSLFIITLSKKSINHKDRTPQGGALYFVI